MWKMNDSTPLIEIQRGCFANSIMKRENKQIIISSYLTLIEYLNLQKIPQNVTRLYN